MSGSSFCTLFTEPMTNVELAADAPDELTAVVNNPTLLMARSAEAAPRSPINLFIIPLLIDD
jgi:hypothetical protein